MSEPLKPRIDIENLLPPQQAELKPQKIFTEQQVDNFYPQETESGKQGHANGIINAALRPKRSLWYKIFTTGIVLLAVSVVAQSVQWVAQAWQQQDWVAFGAATSAGFMVLAGIGSVVAEWHRLHRLHLRVADREYASELLLSHGVGKGREFCEKLARQSGLHQGNPALQRWQTSLHETHNDREVVELYARLVQPVLDVRARGEISRHAAESALMIAVSPLVWVDMAFIAWRNIRLINRIAALYGIELGYFSRIRLFRLVLVNIAFAGVTELVRESSMDWLSQDLTARFSARAAQGIGAGLLTARLGIKAMELCRPLPWTAEDKPRLGDFRRSLIEQLKNTLKEKDKQG